MQKNVPKYTPSWVQTVTVWAEASKREVSYALCNDRRTLLWFANQRAVEYHPGLVRAGEWDHPTHLILDIDPPSADASAWRFARRIWSARRWPTWAWRARSRPAAPRACTCLCRWTAGTAADAAAATRAISARAERLDPVLATTAFIRDDREGKVFIDSTRAAGPRSWPRTARACGRARHLVPGPLGGTGPRHTRRFHRAHGGPSARWERSVGRPDARTAAAQRRAGRRGAHHPHRPRPGHARGQASGSRPPCLTATAGPAPPVPDASAVPAAPDTSARYAQAGFPDLLFMPYEGGQGRIEELVALPTLRALGETRG